MTIQELGASHVPAAGETWARIRRGVTTTIRALQHARMKQALSDLSDAQLAALGLTRADIPRHARECIYDIHS